MSHLRLQQKTSLMRFQALFSNTRLSEVKCDVRVRRAKSLPAVFVSLCNCGRPRGCLRSVLVAAPAAMESGSYVGARRQGGDGWKGERPENPERTRASTAKFDYLASSGTSFTAFARRGRKGRGTRCLHL